jgi:hypothetical protein
MRSAEAVRRFWADGYVFPLPALSSAEAAETLGRLEAFSRRHGEASPRELVHRHLRFKPHLLVTWLDALVRRPTILDAVEALIGPDVLVWASAVFPKAPRDPSFVSWHQDSVTYGLEGDLLVTAWVALTDSGPDNAGMRVIPGSHRLGDLPHRDTDDPDNVLSRGETVAIDVDERRAVLVTLRAGEMSLHHLRTLHASPPNPSDRPRVGYAIRYMAPSMRPRGGPASALLVRGRDPHGHFELEPAPEADFSPAAAAAHARAMALREARVLGGAR